MNLNDLKDERHTIFTAAEALVTSAKSTRRDLAGAELAQYNGLTARLKDLDKQIAQLESHGAAAHMPVGGVLQTTNGNPARPSSLRDALSHATGEEREQIMALAAYLSGDVRAAANLIPAADGGYLIPSMVFQSMERDYAQFAPVVSVARIWGTDNGEPATFPVLSDSDNAVQLAPAAATGLDATVTGDAPPTAITGPKLGAYKVSSKPVFINRELIGDSPIDIVGEVLGALLARVIRFENLKYTTGNGTSECEGFMTNATKYVAGAVPLDLDVALDLIYSVPPLYRPSGVYMASDITIKYLRKLKTGVASDKRYLWAFEEPNAVNGTPAMLHGYPIYVNNDMDSVASDGTFAGKAPLAFGDFKRFVVRRAEQGSPYIYNWPVPAKDGRAVIMFRRSDSKLLVPTAISKVVVS